MDLIHDLDDLLSQMEDVKYKKSAPAPPQPPPKPPQTHTGAKVSEYMEHLRKQEKSNAIKHRNPNCPHMDEFEIQHRAETHPIVPNPHPLNLDEHMTSNTLFPTPAPPKPVVPLRPMSPHAKKREIIKSPFDPETRSDQLKKFGINDSNEDLKFNSYHLDYKYTPPPIKGPCVVCGEGIIGPLVTALDQMWHPEHFCCANCDRELRPPYFLEHDGEPYCKACHQKLFLPPCAACGQYIPDKYINAMGKVWHPECFVCTKCGIMLPEKGYKEAGGKPYCEPDYHELFSPKCSACKKPITDGRKVEALGRDWHPHCFKCTECKKVLSPNKFYEKDGNPYCEHDYNNLFLPKCAGCKNPIKQNPLKVMGKPWHPECFKCTECRKQLSPNNFKEMNGLPYCVDDYHKLFSPKCCACKKPIIDGSPTKAMGQNWHPHCFKCTECKEQLSPNNFKEMNGKPYCWEDYHKLFSPKCHGCRKPITDGNSVRAMGDSWHPGCFKCTECHKQLSPSNFKEMNGNPYCWDDYHKLFSPKCWGCNEPITDGNPTRAMGHVWHPSCFKCTECRKILSPSNFMEKNGNPYCHDDYHKLFSARCYGCKQPITDGKPLMAMGKTWHPEHFSCSDCGIHLSPSNYFEKDGRLYCEEDYHKRFSPRCAGCNAPIKDNRAVVAMGKNWHPECFRCTACNKQLAENAFYEHGGKAYCVDDWLNMFAPRCKGCKQPIKDQYSLYALNGDWHPNCFRCGDCNILLEDKSFYEYEGKPYCERHYHDRMCPDCLKMRRAVERYCGRTTTITRTQQAFRTVNMPPRPNSRNEVQHKVSFQEMESHKSSDQQSQPLIPAVKVHDNQNERSMSSQSQYSTESSYKEHKNGSHMSPYSGSEYSAIRTPSPMPSWNGYASGTDVQNSQSQSSGKFPVGNQMFQFEQTFKKEEFQSISRY